MEYNSDLQVLCKIDFNEAYLNSDLPEDEQVFVQPPPGYVPERSPTPGYKIAWRVLKALPCLKQAGRSWWLNVRQKLINLGYEPCESAPCLFRKMTGNGYVFLLLSYSLMTDSSFAWDRTTRMRSPTSSRDLRRT